MEQLNKEDKLDEFITFLQNYRKDYDKSWKNNKTWTKLSELMMLEVGGKLF